MAATGIYETLFDYMMCGIEQSLGFFNEKNLGSPQGRS
jgi:hypothetical protein